MKLLETLGGWIDRLFEPLNALFRTDTNSPLRLDDPSSMLKKPTVLNMARLNASRTSTAVTRDQERLTRAPDEGGKLEENVRYQSDIERGL